MKTGRRRNFIVALLLFLGLAVRILLILLSDRDMLIDYFFFDDSFYLLNIARNIAAGNGATHDGVHATNGFQALYVLIMVPVYWVTRLDRIYPIYFAAFFLSICGVASAWFCYLIVSRLIGGRAALGSLVFTLFSPISLNYSLNGAETALTTALFLAAILMYLSHFQSTPSANWPLRRALVFGCVLGLAALARVDMLILIGVIFLEMILFHLRHWKGPAPGVKGLLAVSIPVVIALFPWFAWNLVYFGSLIPLSGEAVRQLALGWEVPHGLVVVSATGKGGLITRLSDQARLLMSLARVSLGVLKDFALVPDWIDFYLHLLQRNLQEWEPTAKYTQFEFVLPPGLVLAGLGVISIMWYRERREQDYVHDIFQKLWKARILILFSAIFILAYFARVPAIWFFKRYFAPIFYVSVIFLSLVVFIVLDCLRSGKSWVRRSLMAALCFSLLISWTQTILAGMAGWKKLWGTCFTYPGMISYIQDNFQPTDTFGACQSGYFSYFLDQTVHNLDGVVNPEALRAIKQGRLDEYIISAKIDFLIDRHFEINKLLNIYPGLREHGRSYPSPADSFFVVFSMDHAGE